MNTRGYLTLICVFCLLPLSCEKTDSQEGKQEIVTEYIEEPLVWQSDSILLNTLIPELDNLPVDPYLFCYCLYVDNPKISYSHTPARAWMKAKETEFTFNSINIPVPESFSPSDDGGVRIWQSKDVTIPDFHAIADDYETVSRGLVEGTLTLHLSYPESIPFNKVTIGRYTSIRIPPYWRLKNVSDDKIRIETDSGGSTITLMEPVVLPKSGLDLVFDVNSFSDGFGYAQFENGNITGRLSYNGYIHVSSEDYTGGGNETVSFPLSVKISVSDLECYTVSGVLKNTNEPEIHAYAPFPRLNDDRLNHFNKVLATIYTETDNAGYTFESRFASSTKGAMRYSSVYYPVNATIYMQERDAIYRHELNNNSLGGMNSIVTFPSPDSLAITAKCIGKPEVLNPGKEAHFSLKATWTIPLVLTGSVLQETIESPGFILSKDDLNAPAGTDIVLKGWIRNAQAFNIDITPVIKDSLGKKQVLEEYAFSVGGGGYYNYADQEFSITLKADKAPARKDLYLSITLGTCSYNPIAPNQCILWGIKEIGKEKIVEPDKPSQNPQ